MDRNTHHCASDFGRPSGSHQVRRPERDPRQRDLFDRAPLRDIDWEDVDAEIRELLSKR